MTTQASSDSLLLRLKAARGDEDNSKLAKAGLRRMLLEMGLSPYLVERFLISYFGLIGEIQSLERLEERIKKLLQDAFIEEGKNLFEQADQVMRGYCSKVAGLLNPDWISDTPTIIHYGFYAGGGTFELSKILGRSIDPFAYGADLYKGIGVSGFIARAQDISRLEPGHFSLGLLMDTIQFESSLKKFLELFASKIERRIVVIQSVPVKAHREKLEARIPRMLLEDYLWYLILGDLPTFGNYETQSKVVYILQEVGWAVVHNDYLPHIHGFPRDHHAMVLERSS